MYDHDYSVTYDQSTFDRISLRNSVSLRRGGKKRKSKRKEKEKGKGKEKHLLGVLWTLI